MGLIFGGFLSYIVAFTIDFWHIMIMTKDYADKGYKIKYQEYRNNVKETEINLKYLPYLTLIPAITSAYNYFKNRDNIIRKNIFNGAVIPLSEKENASYNKNRSVFKAFKINAENVIRERMARDLAREFNVPVEEAFIVKKEFVIDPENIIFYQMDILNSENGFTVTSTKGDLVNQLSRDEQLKIIYDYYDLLDEKIDEYVQIHYDGNKKKFEDDLLSDEIDIEPLKEELKHDYLQEVIVKRLK